MSETLHTEVADVFAAAKVEIFLFILAAGIYCLLFQSKVGRSPKHVKHVAGRQEDQLPSVCICNALLQPLSSGAPQDVVEKILRRQLALLKVPEEETQAVLATTCAGLGRLVSRLALVLSIQEIVGKVTNAHLAEMLIRGSWSGRHYATFAQFLFDFADFCKSTGKDQMPREAILLSIQFVVTMDQIETEAAQKARLMGQGDALVDCPKLLTWEKLETIMKDYLPMLDDDTSRYVSFHRILDVVIRRHYDKCWDVLKHMEQQRLPPSAVTCSILLKAVRRANQDKFLADVMKLIDALEEDLDAVLVASLYKACIRCGHMKQLQECVEKFGGGGIHSPGTVASLIWAFEEHRSAWNDLARGQEPLRTTLMCMVEALAFNDPEGAYEMIQWALGDPGLKGLVTAVAYGFVLKSLNRRNCFRRVWEIYHEMIQQKVVFDTSTYNVLLDVCACSGEISRVEPLLKQMADQGLPHSIITYNTVIKAYYNSDQLEKAFKLFEELKSNSDLNPDEMTFNTLINGCARRASSLFDRGCSLLLEMKQNGIPPTNYTLSAVAKLANRNKKPKMAIKIVEGLRSEYGIKINKHVYSQLIHAAVLDNDIIKAQEVFADMLQNKIQPDGRIYTLMLGSMVSHKLVGPTNALLHIAFGLEIQNPQLFGEQLHQSLMKQLSQPICWAKAQQNGNGLQEDVITEALKFLSLMDTPGFSKLLSHFNRNAVCHGCCVTTLASEKLPSKDRDRGIYM